MTIGEALRAAAERLEPTSDTARLDAEVLMAHALGVTRSELLLRHMRDDAPAGFSPLVERRLQQEPVAYIIGRQEFYGLDFEIPAGVLIPRADSETLIEAAREALGNLAPARILDLGTGSGALLLAAMTIWPEAEGLGVDRDVKALITAIRNAERVGVNCGPTDQELEEIRAQFAQAGIDTANGGMGYTGRARFNGGDWRKRGWHKHLGTFDLILANPPYVEEAADLSPSVRDFEPASALFAGPEGLDDYRILIPQLPALLSPNGICVVEIGASQAGAVRQIAEEAGFSTVLRKDLGGRARALILRLTLGKSAQTP